MEPYKDEKNKTGKHPLKKEKSESQKYFREFSDATTLHGIRFVGEEETHFVERIFWVVAIFLCAVFCGHEMVKVWDRWQTSPIIISFAQQPTNIANIPLPAVTICPETRIRRSVVDVEQNYTQILSQLNGTMEYESQEQKMLIEAMRMVMIPTYDPPLSLTQVKPTKEHFKVIAQNISLQIHDIFESCNIGYHIVNCSEIFRPVLLLTAGLCYSFNSIDAADIYNDDVDKNPLNLPEFKPRKISWNPEDGYPKFAEEFTELEDYPYRVTTTNGPHSGFHIILKTPQYEMQKIWNVETSDTYIVNIHSSLEIPNIYNTNYFHTLPGKAKSVVLQPTSMTTAKELKTYDTKVRGCFFPGEKKLKLFKIYTQENCIFDCKMEQLKSGCGYINYEIPTIKGENVPYFNISANPYSACPNELWQEYENKRDLKEENEFRKLNLHGEAARCGCLPSCTELHYKYHINDDAYISYSCTNNCSSNFSAINIYFETPTFIGKHRSELYSLTDFIASCGGLLGLFTGFSVITAIEIFYFASLRICCKLRRQRQVAHQVNN